MSATKAAKSLERIFYVYRLIVQGHVDPFYVGYGHGDRYVKHWSMQYLLNDRSNLHKIHTIKKALREGLEVYSEVIADELTEQEAKDQEIGWIAYYGRRDLGTGCLTNKTNGGDGSSGYVWSDEARKRQSSIMSRVMEDPSRRAHLSELNTGKVMSEDTKRKISASNTGQTRSDETRQKIGEANRRRVFTDAMRRNFSDAKTMDESVYISRLALNNPLFTLVQHNTRRLYSLFRCNHCGGELERQNTTMLAGKIPIEHRQCAIQAFDLRRSEFPLFFGADRISLILASIEPKDQPFISSFRRAGVILYSMGGEELARVRLPESYILARRHLPNNGADYQMPKAGQQDDNLPNLADTV